MSEPEVQTEEQATPAGSATAGGDLVVPARVLAVLKGLMNERRRLQKQIAARALESKPATDLEEVLDSIRSKILWTLEQELGL